VRLGGAGRASACGSEKLRGSGGGALSEHNKREGDRESFSFFLLGFL